MIVGGCSASAGPVGAGFSGAIGVIPMSANDGAYQMPYSVEASVQRGGGAGCSGGIAWTF